MTDTTTSATTTTAEIVHIARTTNTTTPLKRCAIIGTAPSWKLCPWQEETLEVWGLNDGYLLGIPKANRWFDLHPFHQMNFRPAGQRTVRADEVQPGSYLRPAGHLEWLKTRQFPVYMAEAKPGYQSARTFPKEQLLEAFSARWPWRVTRNGDIQPGPDYEVSTPSWMLMLAIAEGYREIHIYGIHLATEWEYVQQRPNFEYLIGLASGLGVKIVLPEVAPICRAAYQYAFAPKSDLPLQLAQQDIAIVKGNGLRTRQAMMALPWYAWHRRRSAQTRLAQLDIELIDAKSILHREKLMALA